MPFDQLTNGAGDERSPRCGDGRERTIPARRRQSLGSALCGAPVSRRGAVGKCHTLRRSNGTVRERGRAVASRCFAKSPCTATGAPSLESETWRGPSEPEASAAHPPDRPVRDRDAAHRERVPVRRAFRRNAPRVKPASRRMTRTRIVSTRIPKPATSPPDTTTAGLCGNGNASSETVESPGEMQLQRFTLSWGFCVGNIFFAEILPFLSEWPASIVHNGPFRLAVCRFGVEFFRRTRRNSDRLPAIPGANPESGRCTGLREAIACRPGVVPGRWPRTSRGVFRQCGRLRPARGSAKN